MFSINTKLSMLKAIITKKSPFYIQFYVSKYCHLKCKMCNIVKANANIEPIPLDKIELLVKNIKAIGGGVITLTGGEPFLRKDIDKIIELFIKNNLDIRLQTAGLYEQKDLIIKCIEKGASGINISLDSLDGKLCDYINGVEGSFDNAVKTVAYINKNCKKNIFCAFNLVLSRYNIDMVESVLDFATKIGWYLSVVPVHIGHDEEKLKFRGINQDFKFRAEDYPKVKALIERLKQKKRQGYNLFDSDEYLDSIYNFIVKGKPTWMHKGVCDSPNLYFAISLDGSFQPCTDYRLDEKIYVYDKNFPKLYKSKEFQTKIKNLVKNCPGCNYGCFPEMTLPVRKLSVFLERVFLQSKVNLKALFSRKAKIDVFNALKEVKNSYPEVYKD